MALARRLRDRPGRRLDHRPGRRRRRLAGRQPPAAAGVGHRRAGQGAVPQQRDQPRRVRPARRRRGPRRPGKSILFMIETNPGPGLGLLLAFCLFGPRALRPTVPGRDDHPVPRRHPRDLLPVRAHEAAPDPRRDRRWRRRRHHLHGHRRRPGRHPVAGQHLRLHGGHAQGRLVRRPLGVVMATVVTFAVASAAARVRPHEPVATTRRC